MNLVIAFISALLFGLGLAVSGMTDPEKVIGFLDIFGDWKPDLILVMGGAIGVHSISFYLITKKSTPILGKKFQIPNKKKIDARLIIGSILFGMGWGISGYCPGPAIASLASLKLPVLTFIISMITAIAIYHYFFKTKFFKENS